MYIFIFIFTYLSIYLSIFLSFFLSLFLSYLSIYLSICCIFFCHCPTTIGSFTRSLSRPSAVLATAFVHRSLPLTLAAKRS